MAATTTIRVTTETRDLLKTLVERRGGSTGEIVAELAHAADDDLLLADAESAFQALAEDPEMLLAYKTEAGDIESAFDAPAPAW
jgi:hypothetical protein